MSKFTTWKEIQTVFSSSPKEESFNAFYKEELSDSRSLVSEIMSERTVLNPENHDSDIISITKAKMLEKINTTG